MKFSTNEKPAYQWQHNFTVSEDELSYVDWDFFTEPGSMTLRLRHLTGGKIQHHLRQEAWGEARTDESLALDINPTDTVWVRKIDWCYRDQTWVSARVIIPKATMTGKGKALCKLKKTSLCEILFTDPNLKREAFQFCCIQSSHPEYSRVTKTLKSPPKLLLARRSVFWFHEKSLLVTEVFSPGIFEFYQAETHGR